MANILLLTLGTEGDVRPFLRIGRVLRAAGHSVTLLTHADYEEAAKQIGLEFAAIDNHADYQQFISGSSWVNTPQGIFAGYQQHFLPNVLSTYQLIQARSRATETILVAHHNARIAAQLSAEKLGLPLIVIFVWPSQITNLPLLAELLRTLTGPEVDRLQAEMSLPTDWRAWLRAPRLNLGLWPDWFAPVEPDWPSRVVLTGFLVDDPSTGEVPREMQSLLAADQPPILLTGGTGNFVSPDFYLAAAAGVQRLGRRCVLVSRYPKDVPVNLPGDVTRFGYLPYGKVLPHVGAIIHHGGIGTCAQALAAGIPQLILAIGADRPDNAQRLQNLGVAEFLPLPRWQPEAVQAALQRLLNSEEVKKRCQVLSEQIRLANAPAVVRDEIEKFFQEGSAWLSTLSEPDHSAAARPVGPRGEINSKLRQQLAELSPEKLELLARWAGAKPEATAGSSEGKR
jgi:rhamnosyltransferase subunit B